jgi:hypothetical protein
MGKDHLIRSRERLPSPIYLNHSKIALKYIDLHIMSFQKSNIGDKVKGDKMTGDKVTRGQNDQGTKWPGDKMTGDKVTGGQNDRGTK